MGRVALTLALALAAGCTEPGLGGREDPIIGGTATPEGMFPGIGALLYDFGSPRPEIGCTGTVIAPTVVLTAAHCVDPNVVGDALAGFTLVHDTFSVERPMVAVASTSRHEQFDVFRAPAENALDEWFDIGLVFLAEPITAVAPLRMPRPEDAAALVVDADLNIVGYGQTDNDDDQSVGVKFDATTKLVSLNAWELQVSTGRGMPQNCHGDSGGPALADVNGLRVVGVVSRSFDRTPQCLNGGVDTRVDAYLDWIFAQPLVVDVPCGSGLAEACEDEDEGDEGGCCSSSRGAPAGPLLLTALVVASLLGRRRRGR